MSKLKKSVMIRAPLERVFSYFSDPTNLPEIWPSMLSVKNVTVDNGRRSFDYVYRMAGIQFEGHSETLEYVPNELVRMRSRTGVRSVTEYRYRRLGNSTEVIMEMDYEMPNLVMASITEPIVRRLNEREARVALDNLKERLERTDSDAKSRSQQRWQWTPR